ncbi:hypothetical protein WOLCODRAFT_167675 [Wolfiporia cocos MD-104 SS10]|uniref:AMP-dependent synthetase/ligase domain-containing protein n=1 Tax=Wolfiporia cocos (strain MD-104) TaxID=742152 RepID=A0A2H3J9H2_WOLCO|nr:hypothetical protein WOLCODRAFT_167675 [Wolfiporia cocos MD-104 SS10]
MQAPHPPETTSSPSTPPTDSRKLATIQVSPMLSPAPAMLGALPALKLGMQLTFSMLMTYKEFSDATHRIAHLVRPLSGEPTISDNSVVAILSNTDHVLYQSISGGHHACGPPRVHVFLSDACSALLSGHALCVLAIPTLADVFPAFSASPSAAARKLIPYPTLWHAAALDVPVLYLHSSSSTGFPKPIPQMRHTLLQWCAMDSLRLLRVHGYTWGSPTLPLFHTLGLTGQLLAVLVTGRPSALFSLKNTSSLRFQ